MSDAAQRLIAENKRTRAPFLDLGACGLHELPSEIGELAWLKGLSLSYQWREWDGHASLNRVTRQGMHAGSASFNYIADLTPLEPLRGLRALHISDLLVEDLTPLAGLRLLETLEASRTRVKDLAPLKNLEELRRLELEGTLVHDLSSIASLKRLAVLILNGTPVGSLGPLAGAAALRWLDVSHTNVNDLAPLAGLSQLEKLDASWTRVSDLTPLSRLPALSRLYLNATAVTHLDALAPVERLEVLDVSETAVSDLTPLASIPLQALNISDTEVTDLSPLIRLIASGVPVVWSVTRGAAISVFDCALTSPPVEIVQRGHQAILNYFRERERDQWAHLHEAKMLIVGEGGAGKTSLLRRLYKPDAPLPTGKESTKGIDIHRHDFDMSSGPRFRLNVWDFAGQEIYHHTHHFFLTRRSLYVLVDDTTRDNKSISDAGFRYWLELISFYGGDSPTLLFQNRKSGRSKSIDFAGIQRHYPQVKAYHTGDLTERDAAASLRDAIEQHAVHLSHIGDRLPASWIRIRADIEAHAAKSAFIRQEEYFDIYRRYLAFDQQKALLLSQYLHDLGVFLHFQEHPLLSRIVILRNEWATEAVFRILDDEHVKARHGRFTRADCVRLWHGTRYANVHPELLALMERFELCYALTDSDPLTWLLPQHLPPVSLEALDMEPSPHDLMLGYRYEFLPKGLISRLTVRLHRFVLRPGVAWATGVLFEQGPTSVLVKLLSSGSEISLCARGPEAKELLSVVAGDLEALNASFQGLADHVDKRIPCSCSQCSASLTPEYFGYKALVRRRADRRLGIECPKSYELVNVVELLDGIRLDQIPSWAEPALKGGSPKTIRVFLASSKEVMHDRDALDLFVRQQNDRLRREGLYLEIIRWENFLDVMSNTRLQDEYNREIRACDLFVCLFFTKTGKFTEEEFDTAFQAFKETGRPRILTYFKNAQVFTGSLGDEIVTLLAFKRKLTNLGHFYTDYGDEEHLKRHFRDQLDELYG